MNFINPQQNLVGAVKQLQQMMQMPIQKPEDKSKEETEGEKIAYNTIKDYWNSKETLASIRALTTKRKKQLAVRLSEPAFTDGWKSIIDIISLTPFCCGENDRNWKADFDWLIKNEDNYTKVIEGKYGKPEGVKKEVTRQDQMFAQWDQRFGGYVRDSNAEHIIKEFSTNLRDPDFRVWVISIKPEIEGLL